MSKKVVYFFYTAVFIGVVSYARGYSQGKKSEDKKDKFTEYVVWAIIFLIVGVAIAVSLDIWGKGPSEIRLILGILTVLILSGALGGLIGNYYRKQQADRALQDVRAKADHASETYSALKSAKKPDADSAEENARTLEAAAKKAADQKDIADKKSYHVSVILGIGAALLVPLLLHILTSNVLFEIRGQPVKAFYLSGFCIAAGMSAEAFIG